MADLDFEKQELRRLAELLKPYLSGESNLRSTPPSEDGQRHFSERQEVSFVPTPSSRDPKEVLTSCTFRLEARQNDKLTEIARRLGVSKSAFVRHSLDWAFQKAELEMSDRE